MIGISSRSIASVLLLFALSACGGRNAGGLLPSNAPALRHYHRAVGVPATDLGRSAASKQIAVVVQLRYNHQGELDRFVDGLARTPHPRYLTPGEFRLRFAPTPQQERRVIDALRANGFTIDRKYESRTTLDVSASSAAVERFFGTEIHDFRQGRYGFRSANVRPMRVPAALAADVLAADADNRVRRHPDLQYDSNDDAGALPAIQVPSRTPDATNVIRNPGFESKKLAPWESCRQSSKAPLAEATKNHPHSGKRDGYAGTFAKQKEPQGIDSICQAVRIPAGAKLQAYTYGISNDASRKVAQFGALFDTSTGKNVAVLYTTDRNDKKWVSRSFDLSKYAGQKDLIAFGVVGVSKHKNKFIGQYVDDVSLTGGAVSPSPSPTPVACKPGSVPSATPTPNMGPDEGWGPAAIVAGFDLPAGYGYAGACTTVGIVIDATVRTTDLSAYLENFGIRRTGTLTNTSVDGGGSVDSEGEATLDLETIVGLAPNANVIVYDIPDLSDVHIEDAYARAVSDAKAKVINSSFGGCESSSFGAMTDADAEGAAATGVTFSASSGDQGSGCYAGSSSSFPKGANGPASGPHFVGVGGSQSTSPAGPYQCGDPSANVDNAQEWNDCVGSGGGGISTIFTPPPYQSGISGASTGGRNVPDVELPAAYDDFYFNGSWGLVWGTSWASPIYVALQTEIDQACGTSWGINTIYNTFGKVGYADFIDVKGGSNVWISGPATGYNAATGFDNVSGIGMPLGMAIAVDDCSVPAFRHRTNMR